MNTVAALITGAMVFGLPIWVVDLHGYVKARNWDALLKNSEGLLAAFVGLWVMSQTQWAGIVPLGVGDVNLENTSILDLVALAFGVMAVSSGLIIRAIKARDNTQTAATPRLLAVKEGVGSHDPKVPPVGAADVHGGDYTYDK